MIKVLGIKTNRVSSYHHHHGGSSSTLGKKSTKNQSLPVPFEKYVIDRTLGHGTFGKVFLATHQSTKNQIAVKFIEKGGLKTSREKKNTSREVRLLKILHHPHIIQVYDILETPSYAIILMEHAINGELHEHVLKKTRLSESEAQRFFRQILSAVQYLHASSIVHRDLKPENLLLDKNLNVKLIDFGFGNTYSQRAVLNTYCGSPFYASPEMTQGVEYCGPEVDVWSLGVILYMMLTGKLPFRGNNIPSLYECILKGKYHVPVYVSAEAADLLSIMLNTNRFKRAKLAQVLEHPWTMRNYSTAIRAFIPQRQSLCTSLHEETLQELAALGYSVEDYRRVFRDPNDEGPIKSLYHLHYEWIQRKNALKESESHGVEPSEVESFDRQQAVLESEPIYIAPSNKFNLWSKLKEDLKAGFGSSKAAKHEENSLRNKIPQHRDSELNSKTKTPNKSLIKKIMDSFGTNSNTCSSKSHHLHDKHALQSPTSPDNTLCTHYHACNNHGGQEETNCSKNFQAMQLGSAETGSASHATCVPDSELVLACNITRLANIPSLVLDIVKLRLETWLYSKAIQYSITLNTYETPLSQNKAHQYLSYRCRYVGYKSEPLQEHQVTRIDFEILLSTPSNSLELILHSKQLSGSSNTHRFIFESLSKQLLQLKDFVV